jgi:DNA-binding NtrC family response regulator
MISELNKTCRVLYLDDTPEDQRMLMEAVGLAGVSVDVHAAPTAECALEWLATAAEFDVLLLDWNLPAVTAGEFLTSTRKLRPRLPVLVVTGEPRTVDQAVAARFGATNIVAKPLDLDEWEELARSLLTFCEHARVAAS